MRPRAPRARPRSGRPARPAQMVFDTDFERDPEAPERCRHCFQGPEEHGADGSASPGGGPSLGNPRARSTSP